MVLVPMQISIMSTIFTFARCLRRSYYIRVNPTKCKINKTISLCRFVRSVYNEIKIQNKIQLTACKLLEWIELAFWLMWLYTWALCSVNSENTFEAVQIIYVFICEKCGSRLSVVFVGIKWQVRDSQFSIYSKVVFKTTAHAYACHRHNNIASG